MIEAYFRHDPSNDDDAAAVAFFNRCRTLCPDLHWTLEAGEIGTFVSGSGGGKDDDDDDDEGIAAQRAGGRAAGAVQEDG
jgi:hypothetical protein